jgi:CRISPR-associated protein Cas1
MIKRTLYFSNPAYLSKKDEQLVIKLPEEKKEKDDRSESDPNQKYKERGNENIIPIEDIGIIILDNQQITLSHGLLAALLNNNCAVVTCDSKHLPTGLFLPLESHQEQSERFQTQVEASEPLKKQLWQQTITAKIINQAMVLAKRKKENDNMKRWAKKVRSGDPDNFEGRAAAYYWKNLFPPELSADSGFIRDRYGQPPNNLLNYGYAILRATVARGLVASGLLPTLGIHHHNKYNAYCLADDIMEPYRPFVDDYVATFVEDGEDFTELTPSIKKQLLTIPAMDVLIDEERSPLMVGLQRTTASLAKCFAGESRKIIYPEFSPLINSGENNS